MKNRDTGQIAEGLEILISNVGLEIGNRRHHIEGLINVFCKKGPKNAKAIHQFRHFARVHDNYEKARGMHAEITAFRREWEKKYGLKLANLEHRMKGGKIERLKDSHVDELLFDIILSENDLELIHSYEAYITSDNHPGEETSRLADIYRLAFATMMKENLILPSVKREPKLKVGLSRRFLHNSAYCHDRANENGNTVIDKSHSSYLLTPGYLVDRASAAFNIFYELVTEDEKRVENDDIDTMIGALASAAVIIEREGLANDGMTTRIYKMCRKSHFQMGDTERYHRDPRMEEIKDIYLRLEGLNHGLSRDQRGIR